MRRAGTVFQAVAFIMLSYLAGTQVFAQEVEEHISTVGEIEVLHPWARAAGAGEKTHVFMEIANAGAPDRLLSAKTKAATSAEIVGIAPGSNGSSTVPLGPVEVPTGDFDLDPGGIALELSGLTTELRKGGHFDLVLTFETAGQLEVEVSIEARDAAQHSHAGHVH